MTFSLLLIIGGGLLAAWLVYLAVALGRRWKRNRTRRVALRPEFLAILQRNVPLYRRMPAELRTDYWGHINVFLDDKIFVGCAGLDVNDEIRVTVAGNACMLLLNRQKDFFRGFSNILIYPDTYVAPVVESDGTTITHGDSARAGESWHGGPIVLSWSDVRRGIEHPGDGHNVVLHEFAHKLDEENGIVDGLPVLREHGDYADWARVLTKEFDDLTLRAQQGDNDVLDDYAASSPPEFFAVATESFFERGALMKERLPDLYGQLKKFYGVDPAAWR